jgi:DNA-binding Lrp family transcriptional regulator
MMQAYFMMIKCELGKTYQVAAYLSDNIEGVSEVYSTSGNYDLLVKFYIEDGKDIGKFVSDHVHTVPHIKDTYTICVFDAFTPAQ